MYEEMTDIYVYCYLHMTWTVNLLCVLPYSLLASQTYFPLLVISAVKIITLSLLVCGQDEQVSGMDQLYTGSGEDDTVQLSTTCSLRFTKIVWFCVIVNSGGPKLSRHLVTPDNCDNTHLHLTFTNTVALSWPTEHV